MAGCWLLLKNPTNRQVLGNAFNANPASTKLAQGMMQKLQATVDVADVNEAVSVAPLPPCAAASLMNAALRAVHLFAFKAGSCRLLFAVSGKQPLLPISDCTAVIIRLFSGCNVLHFTTG